jgi:hypothetical protein
MTPSLHLCGLFERRASLLSALAKIEVVDPLFTTRLAGKGVATRAACHANLHKYLDLTTCAPSSMLPLASTNPLLLNVGKTSDDRSQQRVKFRGDS